MILCMIRTTAPHLVFISERMAIMNAISKEYLFLFNAITDALTQLEAQNYGDVKDALISAQQKAEEIYITAED